MAKANLKEIAYQHIKRKIIMGELLPGACISEEELQKEIGVSRTPVREGLMLLQNEGFVEMIPRKGIFAAHITVEMVNNIFQIRRMIEPQVLRNFYNELDRKELIRLWKEFEQFELAEPYTKEQWQQLVSTDNDFHVYLIGACHNKLLMKYMDNLCTFSQWMRNNSYETQKKLTNTNEEHLQIIDLLLEGKVEEAAQAMEHHIDISRELAFNLTGAR